MLILAFDELHWADWHKADRKFDSRITILMDYTSISKESRGTEKRNLHLFVPGILSVALLLSATLLGPSTVYAKTFR